jgi:hypothetical protein
VSAEDRAPEFTKLEEVAMSIAETLLTWSPPPPIGDTDTGRYRVIGAVLAVGDAYTGEVKFTSAAGIDDPRLSQGLVRTARRMSQAAPDAVVVVDQ